MKRSTQGHSSDQAAAYFVREAKPQLAPLGTALSTVSRLRAFARLLCLDATQADELVALTLLRASPAIRPSHIGPELSAWLLSRCVAITISEVVQRSKASGAVIGFEFVRSWRPASSRASLDSRRGNEKSTPCRGSDIFS